MCSDVWNLKFLIVLAAFLTFLYFTKNDVKVFVHFFFKLLLYV